MKSRPTIDDMAASELAEMSPQLRNDLRNMARDDLSGLHFSYGMHLRNKYRLWDYKWKEKIRNGVDMSKDHPDSISMRVIETIWERLRNG